MASDIQFFGIDDLLEVYQDRGLDRWALFAGKRLITDGDGADDLRAFLLRMSRSGTFACYTLKVYEGLGDEKIRPNTVDDGSFNFKLFSMDSRGPGGIVGTHYGDPVQQKILERLDGLEARLAEPEDDGVIGQITKAFIGMLEEPHKLHDFIGALSGAGGQPLPNPFAKQIHSVGNITRVQSAPKPAVDPEVITEANAERIAAVIKKLGRHDTKFLEHLEGLAGIAEKTPAKFKTLITLLESGL